MKMQGINHQLPTGDWSAWPQTREDAIKQDTLYYHPVPYKEHCNRGPDHGGALSSLVFTKTGISLCCARIDCGPAYEEAVYNGEPTDPTDATNRGYDYYWRPVHNKYCGHNGKKTLDGKCYYCETEKLSREISPRQKAIAAGESWFMPAINDPCPHGHIALRRVNNGECRECTEMKKQKRSDEKSIPELYPDMIIDAETAKLMDFKVYRTGKPCKRGHKGWRYIINKGCVDCMGEK